VNYCSVIHSFFHFLKIYICLDSFVHDPNFEENEKRYKDLKTEILFINAEKFLQFYDSFLPELDDGISFKDLLNWKAEVHKVMFNISFFFRV
jgi:hypothetical protein